MRVGGPRTDFFICDLNWRMNEGLFYKDDLVIPHSDSWWNSPPLNRRFQRGLLTCTIT